MWVLCENTPLLVSIHNLRPADAAEALARSILNGDPNVPSEILGDTQKLCVQDRQESKNPKKRNKNCHQSQKSKKWMAL